MTDLAELIRRRRLDLRLTQRAAAERANVSLATWQSLERPTSRPDGFQDLTLSRAAHSLELDLPTVFDAAGRALPDAQLPPPDGASSEPDGTDLDEMLDHLDGLLRRLAAQSPSSFAIVYGQASEAAQHLLEIRSTDDR